jgi:hypothetical protein
MNKYMKAIYNSKPKRGWILLYLKIGVPHKLQGAHDTKFHGFINEQHLGYSTGLGF